MKKLVFLLLFLLLLFVGSAFTQKYPFATSDKPDQASPLPDFPFTEGWLGADDAYSIPPGGDKSLWLFREIDARYHTMRDRHKRSIAGLSMGGYGAIKLALNYPDLFAFAGSLSGALNAAQTLEVERPEFRAKLLEVFGGSGSRVRSENDVFQMLKPPTSSDYPYFYLACGSSDSFLTVNRAFVEKLASSKIVRVSRDLGRAHVGILGPSGSASA